MYTPYQERIPKTIKGIMEHYNLTYPFIVRKVVQQEILALQTVIPLNCEVTIMKKVTPTSHGDKIDKYIGYVERTGYMVCDQPVWMLVEASDDNVLSLGSYEKFRKKIRQRKNI